MIKGINFEFNDLINVLDVDMTLGEIVYTYNLGKVVVTNEEGKIIIKEPLSVKSDSPLPLVVQNSYTNLLRILVVNLLRSRYKFVLDPDAEFITIDKKDNEKYLNIVGDLNKITTHNSVTRNYLDTLYREISRTSPELVSQENTFKVFSITDGKLMLNIPCNNAIAVDNLSAILLNENVLTKSSLTMLQSFDERLINLDICKIYGFESPYKEYELNPGVTSIFLEHISRNLMSVFYFKRNIISGIPKDFFRPLTIGCLLFELKEDGLHVVTKTDNLYDDKYYKAPITLTISEQDFSVVELSIPTVGMGTPTMLYEAKYNGDEFRIVFEAGATELLKKLFGEEFTKSLERLKMLQQFKSSLLTTDGRDVITDGILSIVLKKGWQQDDAIKQETVTFLPVEGNEDLHLLVRYLKVDKWEDAKQEKKEIELLIEKGMVFEKVNTDYRFRSLENINLNIESFFFSVKELSDLYKQILPLK